MGWLFFGLAAVVVVAWLSARTKRASGGRTGAIIGKSADTVGVVSSIQRPDPDEWAREREQRKEARRDAVERIRASFSPPADLAAGLAGIESALSNLAQAFGSPIPHLDRLRAEMAAAGPVKKQEALARKHLNEAYRLRADSEKLVEALAWCVIHLQLCAEHLDPAWKSAHAIKRLTNSLDYETYRGSCIGFLVVAADALRAERADLAEVCDDCVDRLFSSWHGDLEATATYSRDLQRLARTTDTSDKHFIINGLVGYLNRRRRFDHTARSVLLDLAEQDVAIYKVFLTAFTALGGNGSMTFAQATRSRHYVCPNLPSFDALWDIYEEEGNIEQLRRLRSIAAEIKYSHFENVEIDEEQGLAAPPPAIAPARVDPSFPVEVITVPKSGEKGKRAFLDGSGRVCSTEEAAQDHFRRQGYKVLRGEVTFWQAMFGLAFWEEVFDGTGAPNAFNDIPRDLFSGKAFYDVRRSRIDEKAALIARSDVRAFILGQLQRWGATWTRIVFDGARGQFSYRAHLESADVSEFLSTIEPTVFARIVHRIASNPTENRAGLPDYMIWKDRALCFVEIKGVREQIRDSQSAWLAWMIAESIAVRVVRVKGT